MTRPLRQYALFSSICFTLLTSSSSILLTSSEAIAQAPPEAIKNYEKAKQAYGNGDFELAVEYLQKAYAEDPDLIYQYNRIRALQAMKSYDEALGVIDLFRGPMSRDPAQRFTDLEELEAQIRAEQAQFKADQQNQNTTTTPPDTKSAGNDGNKGKEDGGTTTGARDTDTVTPPPVVEDPNKTKRIIGWTLTGAGAATLLGTAPFWSGLLIKQDECFDRNSTACTQSRKQGQSMSQRLQEFEDKQANHKLISAVGLGVGTALIIPGILLIIKSPKTESTTQDASSSLTLHPVLGTDQAGAVMTFQF